MENRRKTVNPEIRESVDMSFQIVDRIHEISRTLYENGIIPVELSKNEVNLEDYYMKMVRK